MPVFPRNLRRNPRPEFVTDPCVIVNEKQEILVLYLPDLMLEEYNVCNILRIWTWEQLANIASIE